MIKNFKSLAAVLVTGLVATGVQANTISIFGTDGTAINNGANGQYVVWSTGSFEGFFDSTPTTTLGGAALSSAKATGYDIKGNLAATPTANSTGLKNANPDTELKGLQVILSLPTLGDGTTNSASLNTFTASQEYFSIKQQNWIAYFKNTSGGALTINFGYAGTNGNTAVNFSHSNQYGPTAKPSPAPVPIPAAAWLFGSALLGIGGVGARRRTLQA